MPDVQTAALSGIYQKSDPNFARFKSFTILKKLLKVYSNFRSVLIL